MSLAENLRPEPVSTEELRQVVAQTTAEPAAKPQEEEDPRDQLEWSFHFSWTDSRGKEWDGDFTNHILTMGEHQERASFAARCAGSVRWESIDPQMRQINAALAHLEYSLGTRPAWAKDLRQLLDPALVLALWDKVSSHEERFFRLAPSEETG